MSDHEIFDTGTNTMAVDLDGDGQADALAVDLDHDGVSDAIVSQDDHGYVAWMNLDGHPGWDAIARDFDMDGHTDVVTADADGDGFFELFRLPDGTTYEVDPDTGLVIAATGPDATVAVPAGDPATPAWADPDSDAGLPAATDPADHNPFPVQPGLPGYDDGQPQDHAPQDTAADPDHNPFPVQPGLPGYDPTHAPAQEPATTAPQDTASDPDHNPFPVQPGLPGHDPAHDPAPVPVDQAPADQGDPQDTQPSNDTQLPNLTIWGDLEGNRWTEEYQTVNGFCAPVSVAMIASEFVHRFVSEDEAVERAVDLGILTYSEGGTFDGWSGLTTPDTLKLMESFGIPAHIEGGEGVHETAAEAMDSLRMHLYNGQGIVLMVDGDEVWNRTTDDASDGGTDANHAIIIREIDDTNGTVILGDPGNSDGGKEWVMSQADFVHAWDDSNYECVVTDKAPSPNPDGQTPVVPDGGRPYDGKPGWGQDDSAAVTPDAAAPAAALDDLGRLVGSRETGVPEMGGWVILPVVLAGAAMRAWGQIRDTGRVNAQ